MLAGEPEQTLGYCATYASMRTLELENRCTSNRTVGSNLTLSRAFCLPIAMPEG